MLATLESEGFPLYVCTSKHHPFAVRILDLFELSGYFRAIYGDKAEYLSHSKADLLARLIGDCGLKAATTTATDCLSRRAGCNRSSTARSTTACCG